MAPHHSLPAAAAPPHTPHVVAPVAAVVVGKKAWLLSARRTVLRGGAVRWDTAHGREGEAESGEGRHW